MRNVHLGASGPQVGAIGLGCLPLSSHYGPSDEAAALQALEIAGDAGVTLWDTAEAYGAGHNERLISRVLPRHRDRVVVATKFGLGRDGTPCGRPEAARAALEGSLTRLGVDHLDLWYLHRADPTVPIEETVGAMAEAVDQGHVRWIGLCEVSASTLARAHAIHPITALQSEWSLWSRDIEHEVLPLARRLGVGIVAYSPLGRGLLAGSAPGIPDMAADDHRRSSPRFAPEHIEQNRRLADLLAALAHDRGCTPAQLALAWLLAQGTDIVPIPGTRHPARVRENALAAEIELTPQEASGMAAAMSGVSGARYGRPHTYADTPPLPDSFA